MTALLPARVALAIGVDRLLAQRLRNALERARLLAAEKENRGAVADDRLRVIFIHGAQLALRLHEDMRRDMAAPDDGDQPLEIRNLLVRKLVQQAGHMHWQRTFLFRLPDCLPGLDAKLLRQLVFGEDNAVLRLGCMGSQASVPPLRNGLRKRDTVFALPSAL